MAQHDTFTQRQLENLGNRFRSLRIAKGFSNYEQFAFTNGIPRSQYGAYEKGQNITFASLLKVLRALDISLAEFFSEGFDEESGNS